MTRNQFWILIGASGLVALMLLLQVIFGTMAQAAQVKVVNAQQFVQDGRRHEAELKTLAQQIYQVSVRNQDQGLRDLLTRQHITITPPTTPAAAPAPSGDAPTR